MAPKVARATLAALLIGAFLAVSPVRTPTAQADVIQSPTFLLAWGTTGTGDSQFSYPRGVGVDAAGNVYVADAGNHRIQKFTTDGTYLTQWGTNGTAAGQFNTPGGVATDADGNVYVADTNNHRIQKFTTDGTYLTQWGTPGTGEGQFNSPRWVATDTNRDIYVTDIFHNRIEKFQPRLVSITKSVDETTVVAGVAIHYHLTVTNIGTIELHGVTVQDPEAPDCGRNLGVMAVGTHQSIDCSYTPTLSQIGAHANTAVVDTAETRAVNSNTVNVTVTAAPQSEQPPVHSLTLTGSGYGGDHFVAPSGVATDANGYAYVSDTGNRRIVKFRSDGTFVTEWGHGLTPSPNDLETPSGVATSTPGNVYVTDVGSQYGNRVVWYDTTGGYQGQLGSTGTGIGQFGQARGVATDAGGNVYVADTANNRLQVFGAPPLFPYLATWGTYGTAAGQFDRPTGVATDADGNVYVADTNNHRIQKFTSTGTFLTEWGTHGTAAGQFDTPTGVATDADGNVYVADGVNNRIQKFNSQGTFLTQWAVGDLARAVATDPDGAVWVVTQPLAVRKYVPPPTPTVIAGTITETGTHTPLEGVWVVALRNADYHLVAGALTDATGHYTIGVDPGGYRLEFVDPEFSHVIEWYDNHRFDQLGSADTATATQGATTTVDAALDDPTGTVAGTITETGTGVPLGDAVVAVLRTGESQPYAATTTDPTGHYRLRGLPPDDYYVVSALAAGTHRPWFHTDAPGPTGATPVTVAAGTTRTADIALPVVTANPPIATIGGTVTDDVDNRPLDTMLVAALRAADFRFVVAAFTDTHGDYRLDVPDGDYFLEFFDLDRGHHFEWYDNQPDPIAATPTPVAATATATAALTPLRGTAAGTVTNDSGDPLNGVWVAAIGITDGQPVAGTTTSADGRYTLPDIDNGDYYLIFVDPTGAHALEYHHDTANIDDATPITITGSHTTTTDATLSSA